MDGNSRFSLRLNSSEQQSRLHPASIPRLGWRSPLLLTPAGGESAPRAGSSRLTAPGSQARPCWPLRGLQLLLPRWPWWTCPSSQRFLNGATFSPHPALNERRRRCSASTLGQFPRASSLLECRCGFQVALSFWSNVPVPSLSPFPWPVSLAWEETGTAPRHGRLLEAPSYTGCFQRGLETVSHPQQPPPASRPGLRSPQNGQ